MRALALVLLLLASPSWAGVKLAVFTQNSTSGLGFSANELQASLETLNMVGQPYDLYYANARTWGETGTADSAWFRAQGYQAIIILREDGRNDGTPVESGPYGLNFSDGGGDFRVQDSPLSGLWGMPVHVFTPARLAATASYDQDLAGTNDRYIAGVRHSINGVAASIPKPSVDSIGTWRYRMIARISGTADTLYGDPQIFCCRPGTWSGSGTVAALAWADSGIASVGGLSACSEGDTMVSAWRFRPALPGGGEGPGVTFYTYKLSYAAGQNLSILWALQSIYAVYGVEAPQKIKIDLMEHDAQPVNKNNGLSRTNNGLFETAINEAGMHRRIATPLNAAEYPLFWSAITITNIQAAFLQTQSVWMPFSYNNAGVEWSFQYMSASDTAGVRSRWNSVMNTTANADTGAFPVSRLNVSRVVSGAGVVGGWQLKVLADAGVKVIESTREADRGPFEYVAPADTGWALIVPANGYGTSMQAVQVPGPSESRVLYVAPTYGFLHNTTFTTLAAGAADHEYVGSLWINTLGMATMRRTSIYWHTGTSVGVTDQDPFAQWLWPLAARQLGYFSRVAEWNSGAFKPQIFTQRRSFTARY